MAIDIGVVGVGIAGCGIAVGYITHRQDVARGRANEIRDVMIKLIELRESFAALSRADPIMFESLSTAINQKRGQYLAKARSLARQAKRSMSFNDYLTLAEEVQNDAEYRLALEYYERARRKARSGGALQQAIILRYLAAYYCLPSPDRDVAQADRLFAESIAKTAGKADGYMLYTTGLTYVLWAGQLAAQQRPFADELAEAQRLYRQSAETHPIGSQALLALEARERAGYFGPAAQAAVVSAGFTDVSAPPHNSPPPMPIAPGPSPPPPREPGTDA
jgi:hypothetical protein